MLVLIRLLLTYSEVIRRGSCYQGCKHRENDLKGSENFFESWRVLVTEGKFAVKCMTEIQGKSILVRVSVSVGVELAPQSEIELNRTKSNEIEHRTLCEFDFRTDRIQSNKWNPIELSPLD